MADLETLRGLDPFHQVRSAMATIASERGEWAGMPMPIEDARLIVEPTYPYAKQLEALDASLNPQEPVEAEVKVRSWFYSSRYRCDVLIIEDDDGVVRQHVLSARYHHLSNELATLGASDAWGVEQEAQALELLAGLLPHRKFKQYLLAGSFLESSKNSHVTYMFRKLRPTVAIVPDPDNSSRVLCTMCMHPIGYYENSWAGAMCPTDDVIAHLMLMRGDEHMFWRRCNQHQPHFPEAGL